MNQSSGNDLPGPVDSTAVRLADLSRPEDQVAVVRLLDHYARHGFGMGQPLPEDVRSRLIRDLGRLENARVFLAVDAAGQAVALAVCFLGFSTFKARPLINIHDLVVDEAYRGRGIGSRVIDAVVDYAREHEMCAVTLEVRYDNPARDLYARKGFRNISEADPDGLVLFGKLSLPVSTL